MPKYEAIEKGFRNNSIVNIGKIVTTDKPLKPVPSWLKVIQETVEMSPQQKAAITRAANKAAKEVDIPEVIEPEVDIPDFNAVEEPEQL